MVKKAQISLEYMIIAGFVVFVLMGILAVAFLYSGTIKDKIKITQLQSFTSKIISASESVFYSGSPSKATISVYLPEGISQIDIIENSIVIVAQTSSGITRTAFSSKVPISGTLSSTPGIKRIKIIAEQDSAVISPA